MCLWVSPKRTRSYPYARVYDILTQEASKKVSIIPIVKDEGIEGDRDFLQWDTVSLLSLLNVYVIPAYYCYAERRGNKLTDQRFDWAYIKRKLIELSCYHNTALHWNLKELEQENLVKLIDKVKFYYSKLSSKLGIKLHSFAGLDRFKELISKDIEAFKVSSRLKSKQAQRRETKTRQPKELVNTELKTKIDIYNYLGGVYHLTVDEHKEKDGVVYLYECKHSKSSLLPGVDDIKDGLVKILLLKSIDELYYEGRRIDFKVGLKLTSPEGNYDNLDNILKSLKKQAKKGVFIMPFKRSQVQWF
ncbi:hypothetical protein [Hydrogenobacter thermophilus]|uniref:hypothetical protein n=1 Tax=Hydrogenobacter thermophilus TaxID=940 RepID=UPI0030FC62EE